MKYFVFIVFVLISNSLFCQIPQNNLVLWFNADSINIENEKISLLYDLSGNGYNAYQNTDSRRPQLTIQNPSINNKPSIYFNGSSSYLIGPEIPNINNSSLTIFIVASGLNQSGTEASLFGINTPFNSSFWFYCRPTNVLTSLVKGNRFDSPSGSLSFSGFDYKILFLEKNFGLNASLGINRTIVANTTNTTQIGDFVNSNFYIGAISSARYFKGNIAEIILYDSILNENEINQVHTYLKTKYMPSLSIGNDTVIEVGFCPTFITAPEGFESYVWNTGETTNSISVVTSGTYSVTATDFFGFISSDEISVSYPNRILNSSQSLLCIGDSLKLFPITPNPELYTFEWSNGATSREINITEAGNYWVKITDGDGCFAYSDTLNIAVDNFPNEFTLGEDLELCSGNLLTAPNNPDIVSWQWSNGAVTPQIPITESGIYGITVTNTNGCIATDEVEVTIIGIAPETDFSADTVCLGNPTSFTDLSTLAEGSIEQWLWDFGDGNTSNEQNPQHTYSLQGSYMVSLTAIASSTCQKSIAKEVIVKAVPTAYFEASTACINVPYQFTDLSTAPEGLEIVSWDWDFGGGNTSSTQNPIHNFSNPGSGNIELSITTNNSCHSNFNEIIEVVGEFPSPENFSMILPKSGAVISEGEILIQHNSTQNAIEYLTQVSDSEEFSNIILEINSFANDTSYINLPIGNYFVRSKAINICLNETYTPVINFIVFSPSSISNLVLWLEADSTLLVDSLVSVWYDKSGNNHHASQQNQLKQPFIIPSNNKINNKPSICFNGTSAFLTGLEIPNINNSSLSLFVLASGKIQNGNEATLFSINTSFNSSFWFHIRPINSLSSLVNGDRLNTPEGSISFNGFDYKILSLKKEINSFSSISINSVNMAYSTSAIQSGGFTNEYFYIGSVSNARYFNGSIAELLIFDEALDDDLEEIVFNYFKDKYSPPVNLGADKRIVYGFCPVVLDAGEQFTSYLWNTGATTQSIAVNTPGTYSVSVTDIFGFVSSDEVEVRFPDMGLNTMDTTLCQGESMELAFSSAFTSDISLQWNTGETSPSITVGQAGEYTLTLTDTLGCSTSLTAQIGIDDFENTATLGEDRPFCMGDTLWLQSAWEPWQLDYFWNDGSTGSGLVINQAGEYSLTATNPNGCSGTDTVSLSFQGYAPEVSFSAPPVCFGLPTSFTDGSTVAQSEIISRSWLFNDPQDPAGGASGSTAFYTYSQAGIFNASLEVSSAAGCSRSLSQAVQVYHLPEPAFGPPNVCANLNTPFSDKSTDMEGGIASWQWTATDTDGSTINTSTLQNPEFSFPNPGTASLKLITSSLVGCSDSISRNINVRYSPEVDFSFTPACLGDMVSFTNLSQAPAWAGIQSTHWDFGDGDTTNLTNPSHLFQEAGIYPVTLTARAINGCQISLSKDVTVNYPPIVAFETPPICAATDYQFIDNTTAPLSEITSWNWNFSGLGSSTEQNPWFSFDLPGQYNISLEAKSAAGCAGTITQPIEVMPRPVADFSFSPSFGVAPLNIGFQNLSQGAASFLWDFGDGSAPGTEAEPQHTYTQNGIYNAQLVSVSNMGCSDTLSRQIKVMFSTLDIAVGEIHYRTEQDYLICGVTLINLGSRIIESLQLTVSPQNLSPVMETWSGILPSGDLLYYEFNARFPISKAMPQYLCMDVAIPTIASDDIPENNHLCLALDDSFTVLPPYPNPANGNIQLSFILPADENVTIILIDSHGNLIDNIFDGPAHQGINTLYLNASSLNAGLYAFRILYRDQVVVKKMVVVN